MSSESGKQAAGRAAAAFVRDGMIVGLGSASTANAFHRALAERIQAEGLQIQGVAPSRPTEEHAASLGIPLIPLQSGMTLDLNVDGADEVDANLQLIKGGGGALVREKLVAAAAKEFIVVADASKSVPILGRFPLPVAVIPFGWTTTQARLESLFSVAAPIRGGAENPFVSDDQLYILDVSFGQIPDPAETLARLRAIIGVADAGLFVGMATRALFGNADGTVREQG